MVAVKMDAKRNTDDPAVVALGVDLRGLDVPDSEVAGTARASRSACKH
jgi:hypothetical protein